MSVKSPFHGMDPYLEMRWRDIHASLMVYGSAQLNQSLPHDLQARIEESPQNANEPPLRHLRIIDNNTGDRFITAIEVLSPANKVGQAGRENYFRKRREYFESGVNLVEIDLIRQGDFILAVPPDEVPTHMQPPYLFCVRRAWRPGHAELFHASLREPLPNIPIPLRPADSDARLPLQALIEQCYRGGRHSKMNYTVEPTPRLSKEDAEWADQVLRASGRR